MNKRKVGLIAGSGDLPHIIIDSCRKNSTPICAVFLKGEANIIGAPELNKSDSIILALGQIGKLIDYFKQQMVTDIVFAGGVKRPAFTNLKVDFTGAKLLAKLLKCKVLGDDKLLKSIAEFFESYGFRVTSTQAVIHRGITSKEGIIFSSSATNINMDDIKLGLHVARTIGSLDIGQSVIVENGLILGIEAVEGTDNLLKRCKALTKEERKAILIKAKKPNQDERLDMPTIGIKTIENAYASGLAGIAIEADQVFIIDYEKVVEKARELDIFLISVK